MPRSLCMKVKFNLRKVSRSRSSRQNSTQGVQTPTSHCLKMRGFLHGMTFLDLLTVLQISYGVFGVVFGTRMISAVSLSHHDAASTTPSTHTHTHISLSLSVPHFTLSSPLSFHLIFRHLLSHPLRLLHRTISLSLLSLLHPLPPPPPLSTSLIPEPGREPHLTRAS